VQAELELHGAGAGAWADRRIGAFVLAEIEKWSPAKGTLTALEWAEHRTRQVELVLWHLTIRAKFGTLWQECLDDTVQVAANMLRAGPHASPLQQLQGRYV
jgi:hypothetical protein